MMENNIGNPIDFVNFMKNWYSQSNDIFQLLARSFAHYSDNNQESADNKNTQPYLQGLNLWESYKKNLELLMGELSGSPGFNNQLGDNLIEQWKDFQAAVTSFYTQPGGNGYDPNSFTEIWKKWYEYANNMNSQLYKTFFNSALNHETVKESAKDQPSFGKTINNNYLYSDFSRLNEQSLIEISEVFQKYYNEFVREFSASTEAVLIRNESSTQKTQELFEKCSELQNRFIKELISTYGFNELLHTNLNSFLDAKKQLDEQLEERWKTLGLPSRTDIIELHSQIHDLQLKLNRISKKIENNNGKPDGRKKRKNKK